MMGKQNPFRIGPSAPRLRLAPLPRCLYIRHASTQPRKKPKLATGAYTPSTRAGDKAVHSEILTRATEKGYLKKPTYATKPSSLQPPPAKKVPIQHTWRYSIIRAGTALTLVFSFYIAKVYYETTRPISEEEANQEIDLTAVYNETAKDFDAEVDRQEYFSGTMALRSRLVKQARGHILESAAGTGRNSEYYNKSKIKSLVLADKSQGMLDLAAEKWPDDRTGEDWTGRIRFCVGDVEDVQVKEQLRPMVDGKVVDERFDTVVQTLGFCSTDDPDGLMSSLSNLVKPNGRILLLEHGRGYFDWINTLLDQTAIKHAAKHGCWWNRDIGAIVEKSGLTIVEMKRPWLQVGTTWYIVLRKPADSAKKVEEGHS